MRFGIFRIVLILAFISCIPFGVYAECFFKTYDDECVRMNTAVNSFELTDLKNNPVFEKYSVEVYKKYNPENKLIFELKNGFKLEQITPFLESGVYVFDINAYGKNNAFINKKFEYIFDDLQVMPPIVDVNLESLSSSMVVTGSAFGNVEVVAEYDGRYVTTNVENNTFRMTLNNLKSGLNYVRFYAKSGNRKSSDVERIIMTEQLNPNFNSQTSSITLLNDNIVYTSLRNFYVNGKITSMGNPAGNVIYINGVYTLADSSGNFGNFILLNEGKNTIKASDLRSESNEITVYYVNPEFLFEKINYEKVTSNNAIKIDGYTNVDVNSVMLRMNDGKFFEVDVNQKKFEFFAENLAEGKNNILVVGPQNKKFNFNVYRDVEKPKIDMINLKNIANTDFLYFKITDDSGIKPKSVTLKVNGNLYSSSNLEIKGDYYIFDIEELETGTYEIEVFVSDIVGNTFTLKDSINVNHQITLINKIKINSGNQIGNTIFAKSGNNVFSITPSKNIAFKKIYLDGIEQIDYEILKDNSINLNINLDKANGIIKFIFIDADYKEVEQIFYYKTSLSTTDIKLDYIENSATVDKVMIRGFIDDDFFNWSSLKFNKQNSYSKFGKYFEAIIDVTDTRNLNIEGYDLYGNRITKTLGSVLYNDKKKSEIVINKDFVDTYQFIDGNIFNNDESLGVSNILKYYDGFNFDGIYLSSDYFKLPLSQRYGYRAINMKGLEQSGLKFEYNAFFKLKNPQTIIFKQTSGNPEIFFNGNDFVTENDNHFIQGNIISFQPIKSVTVKGGECYFDDNSFACSVALNENINNIFVTVTDVNNNTNQNNITINKTTHKLKISIDEIYGSGIYKTASEIYLVNNDVNSDSTVNQKSIISAVIDGVEYKIGYKEKGMFTINLDLSDTIDNFDEKEINIQMKAQNDKGDISYSDKVKIMYKRLIGTIAKVFIK